MALYSIQFLIFTEKCFLKCLIKFHVNRFFSFFWIYSTVLYFNNFLIILNQFKHQLSTHPLPLIALKFPIVVFCSWSCSLFVRFLICGMKNKFWIFESSSGQSIRMKIKNLIITMTKITATTRLIFVNFNIWKFISVWQY